MSNQTTKKHPIYRGAVKLVAKLRSIWLGRRDSNPRMLVPKTSALPLGDALLRGITRGDYNVKCNIPLAITLSIGLIK